MFKLRMLVAWPLSDNIDLSYLPSRYICPKKPGISFSMFAVKMSDASAASRHDCVEAPMKAAVTSSDFARRDVPTLCSSNQLSRSQAESFLTSLDAC